ncbi:MAG TPA: hypothetical protein DEF47_11875 [Herpetosiphon sp.]|nr:hypothetical protein [Herpetosiphon sp.]
MIIQNEENSSENAQKKPKRPKKQFISTYDGIGRVEWLRIPCFHLMRIAEGKVNNVNLVRQNVEDQIALQRPQVYPWVSISIRKLEFFSLKVFRKNNKRVF